MTYELWNEASGNRIDGFEGHLGLARLLEIVREIVELQGPEAVHDLFIEVWTSFDSSEPEAILRGERLRYLLEPRVKTYAVEVALASLKTKTSQSTVVQELAPAV